MYLTFRSATLFVPGASIDIDLTDMPRPQLRAILNRCGLVGSSMSHFCSRPLIATVGNTPKGALLLTRPALEGLPVAMAVTPIPPPVKTPPPLRRGP